LRLAAKLLIAFLLLVPITITNASYSGMADRQCLATALYYEARGEPLAGRRAVLDTITNRMLATGKDACGVVFQHRQFAWTNKKPLLIYNDEQRAKLSEVVGHPRVLVGSNYKYFYSGPPPVWADSMSCRRIKNQNFCEGK